MRKRSRTYGTTLLEVLIASGLFVLVLVLVGQLTVAACWSHSQTTSKNQVMRDACIALDRLERELSMCTGLLLPASPLPETAYHAGGEGDSPLVFRTYSSRSTPPEQVLAYRFDSTRRRLERQVYEPGFDPAQAVTQIRVGEATILAERLVGFAFRIAAPSLAAGTPLVRLELKLSGTDETPAVQILGTSTRVKSL